jgi:hypothetical protein
MPTDPPREVVPRPQSPWSSGNQTSESLALAATPFVVVASSGINFHVAAWPGHAHQDIALGLVAGRQSLFDIHRDVTVEQFGQAGPAAALSLPARPST